MNRAVSVEREVIAREACSLFHYYNNPPPPHTHTHTGKCWVEPRICVAIKNAGQCKNERLFELVQHCCISCPLQATPIPPLDDGMTEDDGGSGAP